MPRSPVTSKSYINKPKPAIALTPRKVYTFAKATIGANWRIVVPTEVREALQLKPGDDLVFVTNDQGELVARTSAQILRSIRELLAKRVPPGVSLSDELIAERRAEAARELDD